MNIEENTLSTLTTNTAPQNIQSRQAKNKYVLIKDECPKKKKAALEAKKRREKKRKLMVVYALVAVTLAAVIFVAKASNQTTYEQISHNNDLIKTDIGVNEFEAVDTAFRSKFLAGSWRYDGSEVQGDLVHVFIKIPNQLEAETSLQVRYIKQSLCPKSHEQLWHYVPRERVVLHLFTRSKENNVAANCA